MGYRSVFSCIEERLPGQTAASGNGRTAITLFGALYGDYLASFVQPDAGACCAGQGLRDRFPSAGVASGLYLVKRCPPPVAPPRLGEVILLVASLGGYFARKHDGPPGAKAMWTGLQRLRDFVIALNAQQDVGRRCV